MKNGFLYLLNEKLNINGRQIYCKVTGEPNSAHDNQPYVLVISGGPGFGHELTEAYIKRLLSIAEKEKDILPHFIFFDHLGCGKSDKALDPDKEYTVDNFTDLAAGLVEVIKDKFNLSHVNLFVEGGSFGSLVAMNFPARKPKWLDPNSDIILKQITSKVGPQGSGTADYAFRFLQENYSKHPNYENIVKAQRKLFSGKMQSQADYVQNFVLPMASLYVKDVSQSSFNTMLKQVITYFPNAIINVLDITNRLFKMLEIEIDSLNFADIMLGKCSIDVLNHFFKVDFNGFNIIETVKQNKHLYEQIPICLISASEDHVVDYRIAETINQQLSHSSAVIIFKEPHMLSKGPSKNIYDQLNYDLLVSGHVPLADVIHSVIINHTISDEFNQLLSVAHHNQSTKIAIQKSSTAALLTTMPEQKKEKIIEELADQDHSADPVLIQPATTSSVNPQEITPETLVYKLDF